MKWAKARRPLFGYYEGQDVWMVFYDIAIISVLLLLAILVIITLSAPRNATAGDITNFRTARRLAVVPPHMDMVTTRDSSHVVKVLLMEVSAYSPTVEECDASPLATASGKRVYVGGIAADLRVLPFGSIVIIPNYNNGEPCTVIDTGGAIRGNKLDVFLWSNHKAVQWGRRKNVRVTVLYVPKVAK